MGQTLFGRSLAICDTISVAHCARISHALSVPALTKTQREVLTALLTRDGWADSFIDPKMPRGKRAVFIAYVGDRRLTRRTFRALAAAGLIARTPGHFTISDAGRAAL